MTSSPSTPRALLKAGLLGAAIAASAPLLSEKATAQSSPAPVATAPAVTAPVATAPAATAPAATAPAATAPVSPGQGTHGATPTSDQLRRLAQLVPAAAYSGTPPRNVDSVLWEYTVEKDNALNLARTKLGEKLYFDTRLSADGTVSCATCHDVNRGFVDRRNASEGIGGQVGRRNAPTTLNAAFFEVQFWDGRAKTLEDQAKLPITNPIEMGHKTPEDAVKAIAQDPEYQKAFQEAYGRGVNFDDLARAIASFERTLIFLEAPFDDFLRGNPNAISDDAKAGWALFNGKARCSTCHQFNSINPIGTNNKFHNIGVSARNQNFEALAARALAELAENDSQEAIDRLALETDLSELGRFVVTRNRSEIGAFKTQQLRNIGITAPYMHDGSLQTLWDVMDHYNKGGEPNLYLDGGMEPLNLSEREVNQIVAFMFTLTDTHFAADNQAEMNRQVALASQRRPFRDEDQAARKVLPFEHRVGK